MPANSTRRPALLATLTLCLAAAALAGPALWPAPARAQSGTPGLVGRLLGRAGQAEEGATLVTVRGTGSVPVTPDRATLVLGVESQAEAPAAAVAANSELLAKVVAALTAAGLPESAIQTGSFSLLALEAPRPEGQAAAAAPAGYRVVNTVTVTTDRVAELGKLIEAAVGAGANQVQGLQFGVAAPERYRAAALRAALAAAAADGRALAEAMGGRVARVVEATTLDSPMVAGRLDASPAAAAGPPLFPGQTTVDAQVALTLAVEGASLPAAPTALPPPSRTPAAPAATASLAAASTAVTTTARPASPEPTAGRATEAATPRATPTLRLPASRGGTGTAAPGGGAVATRPGLPFLALAQADTGRYRGTRARAFVIGSAADWERMVAPLLPKTVQVSPDYDEEAAVVVFLGERPSPGFAVKVREISAEGGLLTVHVDTVEPSGNLDRAGGPTSPFQIVTLKKADLPAGVKEPVQAEVMP